MAFPVDAERAANGIATPGATSLVVPFPTTLAGKLVVFVSTTVNTTITWPAGFTEIVEWSNVGGTQFCTGSIAYRDLDGSEGADFTVNFGATAIAGYAWVRVTGAAPGAPEFATIGGPSNADLLNPPNLGPAAGAADYLWLAFAGASAGNATWSSGPLNYGNFTSFGSNNNGKAAVASRQLNAASEDPGAFQLNRSLTWVAATVALAPDTGGGVALLRIRDEALQADEASVRSRARLQARAEAVQVDEPAPLQLLAAFLLRVVDEAVNMAQATAAVRGLVRLRDEAVNVAELIVESVVSASSALLKIVDEVLQLREDDSLTFGDLVRALNETVQASEVASRHRTLARIANETLSAAEAVLRIVADTTGAIVRVVAEVVNGIEAVTRHRALTRARAEVLQLTEAAAGIVSTVAEAIVRVISETVNAGEALVAPLFGRVRVVLEAVRSSEATLRTRAMVRRAAEAVGVPEAVARARTMVRRRIETVTAAESSSRVRGLVKVVTEALSVAEALLTFLAELGAILRGRYRLTLRDTTTRATVRSTTTRAELRDTTTRVTLED